jgi:hypothetical protein
MGKRKQERERCAAIVERYATECDEYTKPRKYWDANHIPSRNEMAGRAMMLRHLAAEILGHKEAEGAGQK